MAKKRKDTAQSATLDDFFQRGGPSSSKKPKLRATPQPASVKAKLTKTPFNVSPDEIIVIDSDEDYPEVISVDYSSDIEVLEAGPPGSSYTGSTTKAVAVKASPAPGDLPVQHAAHESMDDLFGVPSLLLDGQPSPHTQSDNREDEGPDFGVPLLLRDVPMDASSSSATRSSDMVVDNLEGRPSRPSPHPLQRTQSNEDLLHEGTSYMQHDAIGSGPTNQWEVGDDEVGIAGADAFLDDIEEADIEQNLQDDIEDAVQACPICKVLLDKMSHLVL